MRQHVYLSSNLWSSLWIIQQPICNEIRRDEPVLFVERFASLATILRYPRLWPRLFTWLRGLRQDGNNLWLLAPLPLFHLGHRVPWLFRLDFVLQAAWIRLCAARLPGDRRVLWMDNPLYVYAVGHLGEDMAVYHVADEATAFPTSHVPSMQMLERRTLQSVNVVFAAAEQLAVDKRRWNANTYTIWNAIDEDIFSAPGAGAEGELAEIPAPRVAFVGVIDSWVDVQLLADSAKALPDVQFVIVGPTRVNVESLQRLANVRLLGRQDRAKIPSILRLCSASLVPFRRNAVTERIVPLKIFEALAAGALPICTAFSIDLDVLADQRLLIVARSTEDFVAAIRNAIAQDAPAARQMREAYGRKQTWRERWLQMRSILNRLDHPAAAAVAERATR